MDYGMIGKIEKSKRYAQEPERISFLSLSAEFKGDNSAYRISLSPEGWDCSCPGFRTHRSPLPYAPGQNVVSDVEKAVRYAEEPDRIQFLSFEVTFQGDNDAHNTTFLGDSWQCNCSFFASRGVCCHTMAMERILKGMITSPSPVVG